MAISGQIKVEVLKRSVLVLYSNIRLLHANLEEVAVAGSDYDVLFCVESKISDPVISQSSLSLALVAPN